METSSADFSEEGTIKKRGPRTSQEQRELFIGFAESHPQVVDNLDPQYQKLWKEVSELMNNTAGPKRSPGDWIANFRNWHYNLTSKRRTLHNDVGGTGGGPSKGKLTRFEERAIGVWTKTPVTGNPVPVSGLDEEDEILSPPLPEDTESPSASCSGASVPAEGRARKRQKNPSTSDDMSKILKLMEKKQEIDEANAKNMQVAVESISTFANAMKSLAESIAKK